MNTPVEGFHPHTPPQADQPPAPQRTGPSRTEGWDIRFWCLLALVGLAVLARVGEPLDHWNPMTALALFGGAVFAGRMVGLITVLVAMFVGDVVLEILYRLDLRSWPGFHSLMLVVYASFIPTVGIGMLVRRHLRPHIVICGSLAGSSIFFLVTNYAYWSLPSQTLYPRSWEGLVACYQAALPFYRTMILGDLFYTTLLFGAFAVVAWQFPKPQLALSLPLTTPERAENRPPEKRRWPR